MKVRAIAVATERSNAIGTIELECTPHALVVGYLGVGSYQHGYAPAALTSGTQITVPWGSIEQAAMEGEQLFLAFDESLSPHNRMVLASFSTGDRAGQREVYRQRLVLRVSVVVAAAVSMTATLLAVPRLAPTVAAGAAVIVGALAAAVLLLVGFAADRRLSAGVIEGEPARQMLLDELGFYLPSLVRSARPPRTKPVPRPLPTFQALLPRTTLAIAITLAASTLAALLMARFMFRSERPPEPRRDALAERGQDRPMDQSEDGPVVAGSPTRPGGPPPGTPPGGAGVRSGSADGHAPARNASGLRTALPAGSDGDALGTAPVSASVVGPCSCARADSPLWSKPLPRLSIIVLSTETRRRRTRTLMTVDVAVINNSSEDIRDLELRVDYYASKRAPIDAADSGRSGPHQREHSEHRVLYFPGALAPAQAIKWSVEGEGTEFSIRNPIEGDIGPGGASAASADMFARLLEANHRLVRLHGALMLTYLGDVRAGEAVRTLADDSRDEETAYLRRLAEALGEVRACQLVVRRDGSRYVTRACLHNASREQRNGLGIKLRGLEEHVDHGQPTRPPPTVLAEAVASVPGDLASGHGVTVEAIFALEATDGRGIGAFEILSGRLDLLP